MSLTDILAHHRRRPDVPHTGESGLAVDVRGLSLQLGQRVLFQELDFTASSGDCFVITGESGCGKSTFLRVLAGLQKPDGAGQVQVMGQNVSTREPFLGGTRMAYVQQHANLIGTQNPYTNAIAAATLQRKGVDLDLLTGLGVSFGVTHLLDPRDPRGSSTLSGGEAQRIAMIRALMTEPGVLVLDEPTAGLDAANKLSVHKQLKGFFDRRPGMTVLEVTHDLTSLPVGYGTLLQLKGGKLEPHDAQTSQNTPVLRPVA